LASATTLIKHSVIYVLLAFVFAACTVPKKVVTTDQYHEPQKSEQATRILNGLQLKALELMNQQRFQDAIQYLQRAIKVEPREAINWHYLAQNYWHLKDYKNCRSMIQRAISYSQFDEDLNRANQILLDQCSL